jgi:preprotein translocase subunit SecD/SecD/SecF fusion protein
VVGPTLGQDSLRQGLFALALGMLLVCVYVIAFYRGLGVVTVGALAVFASMFLGILATLSAFGFFALTLPGIAGVVLTIGLAADSSILINERFQEEVRMGKTIRSAANSGSLHGLMTSVDADLVTLVSAAALYFIAIGPVKGFALTLMIGIFCDILMMLIFKRPLLMIMGESVFTKAPALWGVPKEQVVAPSAKGRKGGVARG